MKTYTLEDIHQMDRTFRLHVINSITGIKPANLIGTKSDDGQENLAIFSSVVHLGSNPPILGFVMRPNADVKRDTYNNIVNTGYYTINHVPTNLVEKAHYTSAKFDTAVSEFERCQIEAEYIDNFLSPFVRQAPVKMGMKLLNTIPIPQNGTQFIIGQIEQLHLPAWIEQVEGKLDLERTQTAGISGLNTYYEFVKLAEHPYARVQEVPSF